MRTLRPPVIVFDQSLHISPFELYRALREGRSPALIDVRPQPGLLTFEGALTLRDATGIPWTTALVLFDDDGSLADREVEGLRNAGHPRCRALYGGLALYELAMVPDVVGPESFLIRRPG